jgi:cytochrome c-type biogenesis protein
VENVSLLVAFGGGIASFVCPCHLPLVPVFMASLAGPELSGESRRRWPVFFHSLFFVLGLGFFLALVGTLAIISSDYLDAHAVQVTHASVGLLIAIGVYMVLSAFFPKLNFECRLPARAGIKSGYMRSFVVGGLYSIVHSPCITPVLLAIMTLAVRERDAWVTGGLLFAYFMGYGFPFLLGGMALGAVMPLFKKISEYRNMIYASSGVLLIGAAVIILVR